ncbi:galacturonosyltransferase 7 [Actinidia rufa]|uniref:Galacturonosyltransferase 7 n=1 Tax=Actinidia rufa TaxID=165716 RepID=A0A7J0EE28_9ERIC|nr:galacturonosyltransferase 7 [Actinidia rufa]
MKGVVGSSYTLPTEEAMERPRDCGSGPRFTFHARSPCLLARLPQRLSLRLRYGYYRSSYFSASYANEGQTSASNGLKVYDQHKSNNTGNQSKEKVLVWILKWRRDSGWAVLLDESRSHLVFRAERESQSITGMSLSYKMEEWLDSLFDFVANMDQWMLTSRGDFSGTIGGGGVKVFNLFGYDFERKPVKEVQNKTIGFPVRTDVPIPHRKANSTRNSSIVEVAEYEKGFTDESGKSCEVKFGSYCLWRQEHNEKMKDHMVKKLKDQLYVARAYYPSIAKLPAHDKLSNELKQNIQEFERFLSETTTDADLPQQ